MNRLYCLGQRGRLGWRQEEVEEVEEEEKEVVVVLDSREAREK